MEYLSSTGSKVTVIDDTIQYGDGKVRKQIIGPNFANGIVMGGYLSALNKPFTDERIGIETGMGDIVTSKLGDISEAYTLLISKMSDVDPTDIYEVSRIVLETVNEYFGGFENIDSRMSYYYPEDENESINNKISSLKGTGAAMCVERSALAHNLLEYLGINSIYKSSGIIKNNNKEVHSYNLIEYDGKYYIFDTSIPNLIDNQPNPLIAEIDANTFGLMSAPLSNYGISATVSHFNPYRNIDVNITYDSGRKNQIEFNPITEKKNYNL